MIPSNDVDYPQKNMIMWPACFLNNLSPWETQIGTVLNAQNADITRYHFDMHCNTSLNDLNEQIGDYSQICLAVNAAQFTEIVFKSSE